MVTPTGLKLVDAKTASSRDLVQRARLNRPFVSPNRRLLAFRALEKSDVLFVAPLSDSGPTPEAEWRALSSMEGDTRPAGWSPNGSLLYFVSSRDGARCLYALRVDPNTGAPIGDAIAVRHFHGNRTGWAGTTGVLSTGLANAVRGGRFLYDVASFSSNIWMLSSK